LVDNEPAASCHLFARNSGGICQLVFPFSYRRRDFGDDAHAAGRHLFVENTLHVGSAGTIPQTRAENDFVFSVGASKHERLNRRFIQFWQLRAKSIKKGIHP
jgi:hypothetical protein